MQRVGAEWFAALMQRDISRSDPCDKEAMTRAGYLLSKGASRRGPIECKKPTQVLMRGIASVGDKGHRVEP